MTGEIKDGIYKKFGIKKRQLQNLLKKICGDICENILIELTVKVPTLKSKYKRKLKYVNKLLHVINIIFVPNFHSRHGLVC